MGKIGNFGKTIIFSVSDKKALNFDKLTQSVSGKWASHERILRKAKSEFLGAELRTISMNITLDATLGIAPRKTMEKIEKAVETGLIDKLVIGGKAVGKYKWRITKMSESWDIIMSKGELLKVSLSLTFEEYL